MSQNVMGLAFEGDTTKVVIPEAPLTFRQRAEACGLVHDVLEEIGVPQRDAVRIVEQVDESLLRLGLHVVQ